MQIDKFIIQNRNLERFNLFVENIFQYYPIIESGSEAVAAQGQGVDFFEKKSYIFAGPVIFQLCHL